MKQRLQKIIAQAGVASRRACEDLIRQGRVCVNGTPVTRLGSCADPGTDRITVDGQRVHTEKRLYVMLNKPAGYLCTSDDRLGRPTVHGLVSPITQRLFTVGRLDMDAEGLLLLTNDGTFAHRAAHPAGKVGKTYEVLIDGRLAEKARRALECGIVLDGRRTLPARGIRERRVKNGAEVTLTIREGKNRQVKRMFLAVGSPVKRLRRVAFGCLRLGALPVGKYRFLVQGELDKILKG